MQKQSTVYAVDPLCRAFRLLWVPLHCKQLAREQGFAHLLVEKIDKKSHLLSYLNIPDVPYQPVTILKS